MRGPQEIYRNVKLKEKLVLVQTKSELHALLFSYDAFSGAGIVAQHIKPLAATEAARVSTTS